MAKWGCYNPVCRGINQADILIAVAQAAALHLRPPVRLLPYLLELLGPAVLIHHVIKVGEELHGSTKQRGHTLCIMFHSMQGWGYLVDTHRAAPSKLRILVISQRVQVEVPARVCSSCCQLLGTHPCVRVVPAGRW
jgi:hypothetical protein